MAFRGGRGRGRGFGRGDFRFAKQESFVLFPDIELPEKSTITDEELKILQFNRKLQQHFKTSPYYLEESLSESKEENIDFERAFDMDKRTTGSGEESLLSSGYLILEPGNFPTELIRGTKRRTGKKAKWNPKRDLKKLDFLEQLEEKLKDQDPTSKKENEEEEEEEEENVEDEDEESDEGDYGRGEDFDDDEDDYNMDDDGDDEAIM